MRVEQSPVVLRLIIEMVGWGEIGFYILVRSLISISIIRSGLNCTGRYLHLIKWTIFSVTFFPHSRTWNLSEIHWGIRVAVFTVYIGYITNFKLFVLLVHCLFGFLFCWWLYCCCCRCFRCCHWCWWYWLTQKSVYSTKWMDHDALLYLAIVILSSRFIQ